LRSAALSWLPVAEPAHRAAIATTFLGVLAGWLLFRAAEAFGASARAAALVVAIYVCAPLTWKLSTFPEVFAGNVVLSLAIAWLSSPRPPLRGVRRAACLALLAGLGLAHQHTIVLIAPLGILGFVCALREAGHGPTSSRRGVALLASIVGLAAGLSFYVYPWLVGRGTFGEAAELWGDPSTFGGLVDLFLRRDYGTLSLGANGPMPQPTAQLVLLGRTLTRDYMGLPFVVAVALVVARARLFPSDLGARGPRIALFVSILLAGPLFVLRFNITPGVALGAAIVERFHLLPAALALVFVAPAFDTPLAARGLSTVGFVVVVVVLVQTAVALPQVVEHHRPTVQRYAENALRIVEPDAIVVGTGDHRSGSFLYAEARDIRRDVVYVQPWLLLSESQRRRMSARVGITLVPPVHDVLDANALLRQLVASGRPVYVTDWPAPALDRDFPSYPMGPLIRLASQRSNVPSPLQLLALNERVFGDLVLDSVPPSPGTWAGALYVDYARPWHTLTRAFEQAGEERVAAVCRTRADALEPR